ncbi:MAG: PLD nuclease N-terminal domain-containing protein [Chloroflexota bacterium]|jgi:hypothetical protein
MENWQQYIPFLIPVLLLQLTLMVLALFDLVRRPATNGPKWLWVLIIVLVNMIGPIIYFLAGRREE